MKRRGFTWIELVVVLGGVLILTAILFPIFARSRETGRRSPHASCQQNIRQIGLGIKQYLSDYDETFPIITTGGAAYGWADACQPYVRNTQLYQCPSDSSQPGPAAFTGSDPNYSDYFYNLHLSRVHESDIQFIQSTIMLGDAVPGDARQHSTGGPAKTPGIASLVNRNGAPVGAATRHVDGANYAFTDGHTKWYKGSNAITAPLIQNAATSGAMNPTFAIK